MTKEIKSAENDAKSEDVDSNSNDYFELQKKIGLPGGVAVIAGTMIGSGIFVSPVGVLAGTNGSVGLSLVLWVACGIIAGIVSLCYCELGSSIKESGAEYAYLNIGYGPVVAFTFVWTSSLVTKVAALAGTSNVFGNYAVSVFYGEDCDPPVYLVKFLSISLVVGVYFINHSRVKWASKLQVITTISKFAAMTVITIGGLIHIAQRDPVGINNFNNAFLAKDLASLSVNQVGLAMFQGLFTYDGFANLNIISEEVKNSERTLPRAILITVPLVTTFYLMVNVAYFAVLTPEEILTSDAVAVSWSKNVLGGGSWVMAVFVCLSTAGAVNGAILVCSRIQFVASRRNQMPKIFSMIHVDNYTPVPALLVMCGLCMIYAIPNDFSTLINAFSFTSWLFYGMTSLSVIILRYTHPDMPRPYKVPIVFPVLAVILSLYLVIAPLVHDPELIILFALGFVLCGPVVYFIFVHKKINVPGMDMVTYYLQHLLKVAPTDGHDFAILKTK